MNVEVPAPDYEGFQDWADGYSDDRLSKVTVQRDAKTGGRLTLCSDKHPAFTRFVKDVRPALHEHGFVVSRTWHDKRAYGDDDLETVHVVNAVPLLWAVAYANGMVCKRGSCRHIRQPERPYCEMCDGVLPHEPYEKDDVVMVNP